MLFPITCALAQSQRWGIWPDLFFDEYLSDEHMVIDDTERAQMQAWREQLKAVLAQHFPQEPLSPLVVVRIEEQRLYLFPTAEDEELRIFPISTSRHGIGSEEGSYKTPQGVHRIRQKIGAGQPKGAIFRARIPTGEIARLVTEPERTPRDNITSRILWLEGLEEGVNRGPGIDSFARYIYIHGTDEEGLIGTPASDGCVRMRNQDVIWLYEQLPQGTLVIIQ